MTKLCLKKWKNKNIELSILFVTDAKIQRLNQKYRHKNRSTDVLSFSLLEGEGAQMTPSLLSMGDIVISPQKAMRDAKKEGVTFEYKLKFLLIHGFLHLLGYDHEKSKKEEKRMQRKEKEYMRILNGNSRN